MPMSARCGGWPRAIDHLRRRERSDRTLARTAVHAARTRLRPARHEGERLGSHLRATIIARTISHCQYRIGICVTSHGHARAFLGRRVCADARILCRAARSWRRHRYTSLPALARHLGLARCWPKTKRPLRPERVQAARRDFAIETLIAEGAIRPRRNAGLRQRRQSRPRRRARRARRGLSTRVYMAGDAAAARVAAIAGEGAEVVRVDGSYDDAVRIMRRRRRAHGWTIVSDTSWEGYERIPRLIMLGYTRMMDEAIRSLSGMRIGRRVRPGRRRGIACAVASSCACHPSALLAPARSSLCRTVTGRVPYGVGARRSSGRG